MRPNHQPRPSCFANRSSSAFRPSSSVLALLACSVLGPLDCLAQDIQTNTPPESATQPSPVPFFGNAQSQPGSAYGSPGQPPLAPLAGTSQLSVAPPAVSAPPLSSAGLVHWGFLHIYPHIAYDVSYGNNFQSAPGQKANTILNEVSPGVFIRLGDHWFLDYTPTLRFYSNRQLRNEVDEVVGLTGSTSYQDWSLGFSQNYAATSQPLIETASQLDQQVYSTSLHASHALAGQFSLDLNANQNFRYVDQTQALGFPVANTREWSTLEWLGYQFAPRLTVGVGAGFTYDNLSVGPDMTSEQLQGRISWTATEKLTLAVSGGVDYRQFVDSHVPDLVSPIFSASLQYHLFENTTLSLSASRSVQPSYFQDAVSEQTGVGVSLHQRLLKHLSLDVSGGYNSTSYSQTATASVSANANNYDSTSLNVRLSTLLVRRVSAAIFFQENFISSSMTTSSSALFNYTTRQVGLALGYRF